MEGHGQRVDVHANNGSSFHLEILGYEFPESVDEGSDSNWLIVYMATSIPQGRWFVTEPCLLTDEVKRLADWFDAVASHMQTEDEIGFTEPNLWFQIVKQARGTRYLRIHFGIECLPPWANRTEFGTEEVFAEFPLSEIDLHTAAEALRSQLSLYPQRTTN